MSYYETSDQITKPGFVQGRGCHRCGGGGMFGPAVVYAGRCFQCGGTGNQPGGVKVYAYPSSWTPEAIAEAAAAREAKATAKREAAWAKKSAKAAVEAELVWARNVERFPFLATVTPADITWEVAADIVAKGRKYDLTDRQATLVESHVAKNRAEADLASIPVTEVEVAELAEGRYEIEGVVRTTKIQYSDFGGQLKMLVELDNGTKVWGSVPSALYVEAGDRVRFTATVERSGDDSGFGFFKRPAKAERLEEVVA